MEVARPMKEAGWDVTKGDVNAIKLSKTESRDLPNPTL